VQESWRADVASGYRLPCVLDERIAAVVECDRGDNAGTAGLVDELLRLRGIHRQRLVGDDMLALCQRCGGDLVMQVVGRGVVDDLHIRIVNQRLIAAVSLPCAERLRLLLPRCLVAAGNGDDIDEAETSDGIDMMRADEPRTDETHPDPFHGLLHW
jgi:hypothetical protein